jgi:hypothetical protein
MTDDPGVLDSGLLDDVDAGILGRVARMHARLDPPPADLDERVRFAIALEDIAVEVCRLAAEELVGSGARGVERTRTVTFDAASLTVMVSVADAGTRGVRLDGWLAPPAALRVELRAQGGSSRSVLADDAGRFVFDGVAHGLAQLLVHPVPGCGVDLAATVVTPSLTLLWLPWPAPRPGTARVCGPRRRCGRPTASGCCARRCGPCRTRRARRPSPY